MIYGDKMNDTNETDGREQTRRSEVEDPAEQGEMLPDGAKKRREPKKVPLFAVVLLLLFAIVITFQVTYIMTWKSARASNVRADGDLDRIVAKLERINAIYEYSYIRDIDPAELENGVMEGYVYGTGDKFGQYMDSDTYAEYLEEQSGEMVGIGIMVIENPETGLIECVEIFPNSPAEEAEMQVGDLISSIEGEDAAELGYYKALDKMRGEEGSTVNFSVIRDGKTVDLTMTRKRVESVSVTSHLHADGVTGIVRVTSFDEPTAEQFRAAMESLKSQGAKRYVFDMRNNPGGLLTSVTDVLDYLVPEGTIIRITDRDGKIETMESDAAEVDAPMAVLTNENTASAAELFTAVLRDYGKSVTVGEKTYGKGTMQTIYDLGDGSALRISFRMYSPPKTENYDGVGIEPDIEVALDDEVGNVSFYKLTDEQDNQLAAAIEALNK